MERIACHKKIREALGTGWLKTFGLSCTLIFTTSCENPLEQGVDFAHGKPLEYITDRFGNRIPDYSTAGYKNTEPLPEVPVVMTLAPEKEGKDDTARIQAALDELGQKTPDDQGFRGTLLLTAGTFRISGQLNIRRSGVVLRGQGQFEGGTVLQATGKSRRSLIVLHGEDSNQDFFNREAGGTFRYQPAGHSYWEVVNEYVPSGHAVVQVSPVNGLKAGDTIILEQRMNQEWVDILGMNEIPSRSVDQPTNPWDPQDFVFQFERKIEKLEGGRLFLSAPLVNPVFARFGTTRLFKPLLPNRVQQSGVEALRLVSDYQDSVGMKDEAHAWIGVEVSRARDCWVKSVTAVHFGHSTVSMGKEAIGITVQDCAFLKPVARFGYDRRLGFSIEGQQILVQRCHVEDGAYPFFIGERTCGPNVYLDCHASGEKNIIGPSRYWAMGSLWDNVYGNRFLAGNRGYEGDGWGWSGINQLFWNCTALDWITIQSPINGWNWAIGCEGRQAEGPFQGLSGHLSAHGKAVRPRSLFVGQLENRIGGKQAEGISATNQATGTVLVHTRNTLAEK